MHPSILFLLLFSAITFADEASVKPGINDKFLDPSLKVEEWTEKFETESREISITGSSEWAGLTWCQVAQ